MENGPQIRPYAPRDRAALRQIASDTANSGQPIERIFPDREVFADLLTNYYTQFEPESVFIADDNGEVVGYCTGTVNTRRFLRFMVLWIGPILFFKALFRGALWHSQTVRLVRNNLSLWLKGGGASRAGTDMAGYPAHLHVNLKEGFRGKQVGRELVEAFCKHAHAGGAPGVHANVSADNERSCRFFARLGFSELDREPRFRKPDGSGILYTIVFGKKLG